MINCLRILGIAIGLILLLSITVKKRTLFSYVYSVISPLTINVQHATESFLASSFTSTQDYTKKLFDNSLPRVKDSVKSHLSSPTRTSAGAPEEKITDSEKKELDQLIRTHR
jgi:uncharacterized membrane protein YukC